MIEINKIYQGDCLSVLKTLPENKIDMCITSPPYWALRDYGVGGQLGLETTYEEYINKLCDIFDEVKRVLKKEGSCWVVIGDTYAGSGNGSNDYRNENSKNFSNIDQYYIKYAGQKSGKTDIPDKSLVMIPFRFAIEMVNRGWILRNTIIWHKPNCLPESIKDRFTNDFEYVFFFVKNKKYYFKQQFEPVKQSSIDRLNRAVSNKNKWVKGADGQTPHNLSQPHPNYKKCKSRGANYFEGTDHLVSPFDPKKGRNKRTVWEIPTAQFKGNHFATFPNKLIEPLIDAGCPENGIVLDPFMGSGTTACVSLQQNKNYIGIELNQEYCEIANKRIAEFKQQMVLV